MAKIKISTSPAAANNWGGFSVIMHLDGRPDPFPTVIIETNKTADALIARDKVIREVSSLGLLCVVSMRLIEGRAPSGFKKAMMNPFYTPVNL